MDRGFRISVSTQHLAGARWTSQWQAGDGARGTRASPESLAIATVDAEFGGSLSGVGSSSARPRFASDHSLLVT